MEVQQGSKQLTEFDVAALLRAARVSVPDERIVGLTLFANTLRGELNKLAILDLGEAFPAAFDARWER